MVQHHQHLQVFPEVYLVLFRENFLVVVKQQIQHQTQIQIQIPTTICLTHQMRTMMKQNIFPKIFYLNTFHH